MQDATLKQLRALAAVVRHGSIARAAERLHVTPPAVGQQIRLLERAAGTALLERTPNGFRPTDAGCELVAMSDRIEAEIDNSARVLELIRTGKVGSVTLGAVSTAKYFAPQLLAAFWGRHDEVDVRLVIGNRHETIEALAEHAVDVAIMGRPPHELNLVTEVIGDHPHVIIAPPDHPLARRPKVRQRDLERETFLVREPGSGTRQLTESLFAGAGIEPRIGMEIASNETIKQAVIAGLGVALLSAHTIAAELDDQRLVALAVEGLPIMRRWYAVRPTAAPPPPAVAAMWKFLTAEAVNHLPA